MNWYAGIGSRETPQEILQLSKEIAAAFAAKGLGLRSGHAIGSDLAFESGCDEAGGVKEIWVAEDSLANPHWEAYSMPFHPAPDRCSQWAKNLHARNAAIILGKDLDDPVKFVVCWTKDGKATGGTGQGIRIAEYLNIPVFNLRFDTGGEALKKWYRENYG